MESIMTERTDGNDLKKVNIPDSILKDAESMMDFLFFMDKDHATYAEMSEILIAKPYGFKENPWGFQEAMLPILEDQVRWIVSMENKDQISSIEDGQGFVNDYVNIKKKGE